MGSGRFIPFLISQSGAIPTASALQVGELAFNSQDNLLFARSGSSIVLLAAALAFSASYAQTASLLLGSVSSALTAISASYGLTASYATLAQNVLGSITSASYALTASYASNGGGSTNFSTGSYTGSFTGSLLGSSSYASTSSAATSLTFVPASSSYAVTASYGSVAQTLSGVSTTLFITPSIVSQATYTSSITLANRFMLFSVSSSCYSRVELYSDPTFQFKDLSRYTSSFASASSGIIVDVVNSGSVIYCSPIPLGSGGTGSFTNIIPYTVTNLTTTSTAISVSVMYLGI